MTKRRRLLVQLYPPYLALIFLSLMLVTWHASRSFHDFFLKQAQSELNTLALLFSNQMLAAVPRDDVSAIDRLCKETGKNTATRITVILPDGQVIGDSEESPKFMENHGNRPEIVSALNGGIGTSVHMSNTLRRTMMYLALPVKQENRVVAVIRTSLPLTDVEHEINSLQQSIGLFGVAVALLAAGVCFWISRRITRPIETMTRGAERFATGELKHRLSSPNTRELAGLARAMNQMASELENRMETVVNQSKEYEAVLTSMTEGVVAVDMEERIMGINPAAAGMLSLTSRDLKGRSILEVVRNQQLHRSIQKALKGGDMDEEDVVLSKQADQVVHVQCIPLNNSGDHRIGTLVVMNDVTQIRRLENVRRDFVANVSHEIKTPLTAIKGFVETLQSGGTETPEEQEKFLGIIRKHADRLDAIVEDLLALARLEQKEENCDLSLTPHPVSEIIDTSVQMVQKSADDKKILIEVTCDPSLQADMDATLMEQAIVNLLDNAVKYSPPESLIRIEARADEKNIFIQVIDKGPGISKNHLPRLFERFYRVDRARSRTLGGTGLGLAIVKHIAQAHGGSASVESIPGQGSRFSILFPQRAGKSN